MAEDREPFLSRWSRRKRDAAAQAESAPATKAEAAAEAPPLPPLEQLTPDSDFSAFMHAKVDDRLRRAALKKLFADPRFNVVDGLDDYAEDFTKLESLAPEAARRLEHARTTLFGRESGKSETPGEETTASAPSTESPPAPSGTPEARETAAPDARDEAAARRSAPRDPETQSG